MQLQALFFLTASMPTIAYARALNARDEDFTNRDFSGSCKNVGVEDGHVLQASCPKAAPVSGIITANIDNKLDLNKCIGLDSDGKLAFQADGQFGNSCDLNTCELDSDKLTCKCGADNVESTIELNKGIGNREGTLQCDGGKAEATESDIPVNRPWPY